MSSVGDNLCVDDARFSLRPCDLQKLL